MLKLKLFLVVAVLATQIVTLSAQKRVKDKVKSLETFVETVNGVQFKMIYVEGGAFQMGERSEKHEVTLSGFHIGETEVTQALWQAVMGNNPSYFKGADRPVESISWNDAQVFLEKLSGLTGKEYALPTEAQWEYAARGGNRSRGYEYAGSNRSGAVAWNESNSGMETHPVGRKQANELGIYDMSGNVWEWCSDWYGDYPTGRQTDPVGPATGSLRVLRGGSWRSDPHRATIRNLYSPDDRLNFLGFRVCLRP